MRTFARAAAAFTLTAAVALSGATSAAAAATGTRPAPGSVAAQQADSVPGIPGLPTGAPPAASAPLPALPAPSTAAWPFPNDWSQTEGTGHYSGGAWFFTDFVYDDHGPATGGQGSSSSGLAPVHGSFTYPTGGKYDGGNADIFGAAVGDDGTASYWRVDWASMPDPAIPIAEWTIGHVGGATAMGTTWPANAGVATSRGFDDALVVTSAGAELLSPSGAVLHSYPTSVDPASYSFIVEIPHSDLPVPRAGTWDVQLASGLNGGSYAFATVPSSDGGSSGGANVYNITFRAAQVDEKQLVCPAYPFDQNLTQTLESGLANQGTTAGVPTVECANNWMENDQANTLRGSAPDVGKYTASIDWATIADRATPTVAPLTGYSNRWYVTPLPLPGGVRPADSSTYTGPTYLDRVQVYAVDVPAGYDPAKPTPLTWILHSLGANLNQYGGTDPTQVTQECDDRGNICATTEGLSDGEWYYGEAEVDFFDVWHALAASYDLDPDATTISGYSMGGWASYKLAEEHPSLFAQAMPLEGPVICGDEITPSTSATMPYQGGAAASQLSTYSGYRNGAQCAADSDSAAPAPPDVQRTAAPNPSAPLQPSYNPLSALDNLYWIPYSMTCGAIDELVAVTGCQTQANRLAADGLQLFEAAYPAEDHLVFATQNDFTPTDTNLRAIDRKADPGRFSYTWYPDLTSGPAGVDGIGAAGEVGPSGAYWVSGLTGANAAPGATAAVIASSAAIPDPAVTYVDSQTVDPGLDPTPAVELRQSWQLGATPAPQQSVSLQLANVHTATVDAVGAGLGCGTLTAATDEPVTLTLTHLAPASAVTGAAPATADQAGTAVVTLAKGTSTLSLCSATTAAGPPATAPEAPLAVALPAVALAAGYGVWRLRRRL